jgi:hypothetical protein
MLEYYNFPCSVIYASDVLVPTKGNLFVAGKFLAKPVGADLVASATRHLANMTVRICL